MIGLLVFLVRIYNLPEDKFQDVLTILESTRMGNENLSLKRLHEIFYREYMFAFK